MTELENKIQKIYEKYSEDNIKDIDRYYDTGMSHADTDDLINANLYSALEEAKEEFNEIIYMLRNKLEEEIRYVSGDGSDYSTDTKFQIKQLCYELQGIIKGSKL